MQNEKSPPRAPSSAEKDAGPRADPSGKIPPNALHTPTPPETQPSSPHYEKIPKLPSDP